MKLNFKRERAIRKGWVILAVFVGAAVSLFVAQEGQEAFAAAVDGNALQEAVEHYANLRDEEALEILSVLGEQGLDDANVLLGYLYSDPLFDGKDYRAAISYFKRAAANGHPEALFQLAESRYWPLYIEWPLSPERMDARLNESDAYQLLQRAIAQNHNAAKLRLAYMCIFDGFPCSEADLEISLNISAELIFDNLRILAGPFTVTRLSQSDDASSPETIKKIELELAVSYSVADPFMAAITTDPHWERVKALDDCPDPEYIQAAGRLFALSNDVATQYRNSLDLDECYSDSEIAAIEERLVIVLDQAIRTFGEQNSWHLRWCYQDEVGPLFGACLTSAVRDHFFSCSKLSMPRFFEQYDIEYRRSARYVACRENLLGDRP